ncbi:Uncharacterized protein APZ42_033010 [Daphnia magna]|uniref:Uncharacterized protein n=1 Tax=Daphnia magna TaxID=35525 RepID=A0A162D8B9_9CRUS|nr:Uncharacterized protein APZ42_033010 [Daphnia magna]
MHVNSQVFFSSCLKIHSSSKLLDKSQLLTHVVKVKGLKRLCLMEL